jgi:hypothetical protein
LLGAAQGRLYLYRADEIAAPGRITDQIWEALTNADVVIADITGLNPNVMWELGCADGLGRTSVILNQNPGSSPFDLGDRRQVAYHMPATKDDEKRLLRHLIEALRATDPRAAGQPVGSVPVRQFKRLLDAIMGRYLRTAGQRALDTCPPAVMDPWRRTSSVRVP